MMFKKLKISVGLSLLVHLLLLLCLSITTPPDRKSKKENVISVEFLDTKNKKTQDPNLNDAKQIVDQGPAVNQEIDEKAKYLSEHNQKVVKQTIAPQKGAFQNVSENNPLPGQQKALPGEKKSQPEKTVAKKTQPSEKTDAQKGEMAKFLPGFDFKAALQKRDTQERNFEKQVTAEHKAAQDGENGGGPSSQTNDYLKDVDKGAQTLLSTREFVYFSYFNRIRNQLSQYWEPIIKQKITKMFKQGRTLASTDDKITKVIIVLNTQGVLVNVQVINASGVSDLDDAAVEAFKAAAPFPNPPKGIEEKDGTIKIRWDFVLEA